MFSKPKRFLTEVKAELKKCTWPQRKELIGATVVVLIAIILIGFVIGIVDMMFQGGLVGKYGLFNLLGD